MPLVTLRPAGVGDETGIASQYPSSGSHYEKVADSSDGNYIFVGAPNGWYRDLYAPEQFKYETVVNGLSVYARCKYGYTWEQLTSSAKIAIKTHSTVYESDEIVLTSSWANYSQAWALNPFTSAVWTQSEMNSLQIGISLQYADYGDFQSYSQCSNLYAQAVCAEPVPVDVAKRIIDTYWSTYPTNLAEPSLVVVNNGSNALRFDLNTGDAIFFLPGARSEDESYRYLDSLHVDRGNDADLRIQTKHSRDRLLDLVDHVGTILREQRRSINEFQVVRNLSFNELNLEQKNIWAGIMNIRFESKAIDVS